MTDNKHPKTKMEVDYETSNPICAQKKLRERLEKKQEARYEVKKEINNNEI